MATQNISPVTVRTLPPPPQAAKPKVQEKRPQTKLSARIGALPFWSGMVLSVFWAALVFAVVARSGPAHMFAGLPLVDWAIGISAIMSPVALIWMVAAYLQRAADVQSIAEPLRRQLSLITGESGAAEARIRRFNQAIREQIDLLKNAQGMTMGDLSAMMDRVRQHRDELERFEHSSILQVKEIQEIVRRNMQQVEQLMDDKFTMLRVLDGKLVQNGDAVARQTESVRDQISELLQEIEGHSNVVAETLNRSVQDSKKLTDMTHAQESTLTSAAESVAETLSGLSSKIDLSVARFLERTGTAREEAERLAGALDAQTRSLDEFSSTMPTRVSEAEAVIRGVADRLYASELLAREQATSLSQSLSGQVDGLQNFMDKFTARIIDIDSGLGQRRQELDTLADRIGNAAGEFVDTWDKSMTGINARTDGAIQRFSALNAETRQGADSVIARLDETTAKYESAALRVNKLTEDSQEQMRAMTGEIAAQLVQFETLSAAARQAGVEVEDRASAALQNLQQVLERLLTARDTTNTVGETLVKDLYAAVDQNEHLISRLNEAAQMSVYALGVATESLGKQQGSLTDQARAAETALAESALELQQKAQTAEVGLRRQADELKVLLRETEMRMSATEIKLQSLATTAVAPVQDVVLQIDTNAERGLQALSRYGEGLQGQLSQLQHFHIEVGGMGDRLTHHTAETIEAIDQLNNRFVTVRSAQQETARQTLEQFADFSDRLQREVSAFEGQSAQAVTVLQQAAAQVGEQSYQVLQNAENSSAKMKLMTAGLQTEATQIRAILQKQVDDLSADLNLAERQFSLLSDGLRQRTDAIHSLLDRVTAHYNDATRTTAEDLESRAERYGQITDQGQAKSEAFAAALSQQILALTSGATQLETQAQQINQFSGKALQQLSALNEKLNVTGEAANTNARQIAARLEETGTAFLRQSNALSEAAQSSTGMVQKAGGAFGEQAGKLLETSYQADQNLRQLMAATSSFAEQSSKIRAAMEQQNQGLVTELAECIAQMEGLGRKLDQTTSIAMLGADQAASRFTEMTQTASAQLDATQQGMQSIAGKAETTLSEFGAGVTRQAASLALIGEQLADQYKAIAVANESQRTQLVDLFDKLGSAHGQASDVAERTIARLTDSLTQIQRHLGTLSDQSQATIGNVRAASDGFADQSALLVQNAQNAEQQARTVLSVTATLQDQARQLREAMQGESDRAGEMLGSLLGKLSSGSVELRGLSSTAENSLTSLHGTIVEQSQSLNGTMQQVTERQRNLTTALDAQREVLNGLLNRLTMAQDETASVAERTTTRLADGAEQIRLDAEALDAQVRRALEGIKVAGAGFNDESMTLIKSSQHAEHQARSVLTMTTAMQDQARQLSESMQTDAERTTETLNGLLNRITSGGRELRDVGTTTEASLVTLNGTIVEQSQSLNGTMQQVADRQRNLTSTLDAQREVLNGLLNRLTMAQDETASVAERTATRLTEGADQIQLHAEALDVQIRRTLEGIKAAGSGFNSESLTLIQNSQNAEQQARSMLTVTVAMQDQVRSLSETMQTDAERTTETLTGLLSRITSGGRELRDVGSTTETSLASLHTNITEQAQALAATMQQVADRQRTLTTALDAQRDVLNGLLGRLNLAQDETASVTERTAIRMIESAQQVSRQAEMLGTQARDAMANVQATGSGFANESSLLIQNAQNAVQQARSVLSVTAALQEQSRQSCEAMQADAERAHEVLNSLLSRIISGGGELRDMGSSAEMSLNSLHNGVTQQGQELAAMMLQISDRQRSLAVALDAQRDVLNGLLTRFNLAQDETATVTERNAARLAESAQQITRQTEAIETRAQEALSNVQAVGAGFVEQSGLLGVQAQQAEQHVRGILSVTANLQDQARQIREAMQSETSRAVEQLNTTIAQLDASNGQLKQQTGTAINAMDQTALQFATLAHTSAEAMQRQAQTLSETAETAEERMSRAGEKMRGHLKLVSDVGEQAEVQARQLADAAEYATNRLVTLRETITDSDRDGQDVLTRTNARMAEVKAALQSELQNLAELSQHAVQQITAASQSVTTQSDALRVNLAMSESALSQAANLVREEAVRVPVTLDRSTAKIEQATDLLKSRTEEADTILVGTADRFISVTMTARESMIEEMRRVSTTVDHADAILQKFSGTLAGQIQVILQNTSQLSEEQKQLVARSESSVAQLAAASDRLAHLRGDAAATAEKLALEFDALDQRAASTGERLSAAGETVIKNVDALAQVTQRAESQMLGASSQFRDQLERIRTGLQTQIDDINRGLMQITAQLERTGNTLRSTTAGTAADVERIAQRFDQTSKDAGTHLTEKTARMRGATEEVAKLLSGFGDQLDVLLDRLSLAGDGLRRQEGGLVEQMQKALSHLGTIAERLETSRKLALDVSDQTTAHLGGVVETLQREMTALTNNSQSAAGIIRGIGQIYGEQTQTLNKGVRDAHGQVIEMNKSVDEMQQRTDRMRVSLKLQSQELMDSLGQILRQLSETGDVLTDTVDQTLREQVAANLKKMN